MFAAFSFPKPESCDKCPLLASQNKYSGVCALNRDIRYTLNSNERAKHCPLIFFDDMKNTFPISKLKEALDVLIEKADSLSAVIEDNKESSEARKAAGNELAGLLYGIKMIADKLKLNVTEWYLPEN